MVLDHLSLVKAIAIRVHESLPVHVDLDDLVHAGVLGLFDAASKYNPDKKVVFQSYAKHRVKGAILDSLRQLDWASRDLRKRQKQLDSVTHDLMTRLGRTPTEAEIAENLGLGHRPLAPGGAGTEKSRPGIGFSPCGRIRKTARPSNFPPRRIRGPTTSAPGGNCAPFWRAP